jgi:O-antigen chain-terminating methyltransferase
MDEPVGDLDLDRVIAEITERVAANTANGVYSSDLDDELRSHYARLLDRSDGRDRFDSLRQAIDEVAHVAGFSKARIDTASGVPGGQLVHKTAGKLVSRQTLGLIEQLNSFSHAVVPALQSLAGAIEDPRLHTHADLVHELDSVQDRLAAVERSVGRLGALLDDLDELLPRLLSHTHELEGVSARLAAIEELERRRSFTPPFSSRAFGDATRGSAEDLKREYEQLADSLVGVPGPVLDIGAGRGEFLELLRSRDVAAWGVELDDELAVDATERGIDVRAGDGIEALRAVPSASLGAVVLLHVIEHLQPNELLDVLTLAHEKLAVGGKLVLETPNPQSLYIYARAFWIDPTHVRPVHPVYLEFALRSAGFAMYEFDWTALPSSDESMLAAPEHDDLTATFNQNMGRLNDLLFAAQNYRAIATR